MNRYGRGGSIKATASTLCQKCLQKDIFECKAGAQQRPYFTRPSRSQQLLNPKLMPKLTSDTPPDLLKKKGVADEQLAKAHLERGRKRDHEDNEGDGTPKRRRSVSASSVSTISTSASQLQSPRQPVDDMYRNLSKSPILETFSDEKRALSNGSQSSPRQRPDYSEKKRRRRSVSSVSSYTSEERQDILQNSAQQRGNRNTRRRFKHRSPDTRGRRTVSRSPRGDRQWSLGDRPLGQNGFGDEEHSSHGARRHGGYSRERSPSPYSKRLALTQEKNTGR